MSSKWFYIKQPELSRLTAWATPRALMGLQTQSPLDTRGVAHAVKRSIPLMSAQSIRLFSAKLNP